MIVIATVGSPYFLTAYNIQALARDLSFAMLIAMAMSMLLLLGELDLSVGANASLSGVLAGTLMVQYGVPAFLAFVIGALLGGLFGAINGVLVAVLRLNSLVVTIGMTGVYSGIALVLTKGKAITGIPEEILFLGKGAVFGIPIPFLFAIALLILVLSALRWTPFGRYVYAIGNSADASRLIGIKVDRIRIAVFAGVGMIAGLAGMLYVARLGSSQTSIGGEWAINAIAAAVIGGVALHGGIGSPLGAAIGAAIISVISNIIVLFGVNVYWQSAVSGIVVVLAISLGSFSAMRRARRERQIKTRDAENLLKVGA
jgi:ribose transport system permease protein